MTLFEIDEFLDEEPCPYPEVASMDVRRTPHPQRMPLLFAAFRGLEPEQAFRLVNDHDPISLRVRLSSFFPGQVAWEYVEEGPEVWQVRIGRRPASADKG